MIGRRNINIDEALQSNKPKTYEDEDKKAAKYKRKTTQINVYVTPEELEYLDKRCEETFLSRNGYIRKMLVDEMKSYK